jgi:hypothetical protein
MSVDPKRVDLRRLAEGLRAIGWTCDPLPDGKWCFTNGQWGTLGYYNEWDGKSEHPALAFAMLDVLEKAGPTRLESDYEDERIIGFACVLQGFWGKGLPACGTGATRTEAIALALIAAHDAGLLSQEVAG